MSLIAQWTQALVSVPSLGSKVKVLHRSLTAQHQGYQVVVDMRGERWELATILEHYGEGQRKDELSYDPPPAGLVLSQLHANVRVEHLVEYITTHDPLWYYRVRELALETAAWFVGFDVISSKELPKALRGGAEDKAGLIAQVATAVMGQLDALLEADDPRLFVTHVAHKDGVEDEAVLLSFRPDTIEAWDICAATVGRLLRAVLPGCELPDLYSEELPNPANGLTVSRGSFDLEKWRKLDADRLNSLLAHMPNDPVECLLPGNHAMELLVTLAYPPDDEELDYLFSGMIDIDSAGITDIGVLRICRTQPAWLYGGQVVSLLVAGAIDAARIARIEKCLREHMQFSS